MTEKILLAILRHDTSLNIVRSFAAEHGITAVTVAIDPIEAPDGTAEALAAIRLAIPRCAAIALGTKVYDTRKDGPSRLGEFLALLKDYGVTTQPVCLTHLHDIDAGLQAVMAQSGLRVSCVGNDNLKRDEMKQFGPLLLKALSG